jgi:hypothetical protein
MRYSWRPKNQQGVAAIIVGLSIFVLMGFAGLVVDLGRLFVAKAELQTAVDSCALAASRHIKLGTTAQLQLATAVGIATGNRHRAVFQNDELAFTAPNVTFSSTLDGTYESAGVADPATTAFVRCEYAKESIAHSFMQVLGISYGRVTASAKASLTPSIAVCMLPLALCSESKAVVGSSASFTPGMWYQGNACPGGKCNDNGQINGSFRWVRLPGDSGASDLKGRIEESGACEVIPADTVLQSENGNMKTLQSSLNTRFGIYENSYLQGNKLKADAPPPDRVGYAYYPANSPLTDSGSPWVNPDGTTPAYPDYEVKWVATSNGATPFSYQVTQANELRTGAVTGLPISGNPEVLTGNNLYSQSADSRRRLMMMPVTTCGAGGLADASGTKSTPIEEWACVFLLHPMDESGNFRVEYIDAANTGTSPCGTGGAPGPGGTGPLVPGLVQ